MYAPVIPPPAPDLWYGTTGPRDAKIVFVLESWGASEAYTKRALQGASGAEFDRMLADAGLRREDVFCTNCFAAQPPSNDTWRFFDHKRSGAEVWKSLHITPWIKSELERLYQQLRQIQPTIVIAAGNYARWALAGEDSLSFSSESTGDDATVLVPTGISSWRGSMLECSVPGLEKTKLLPIYHPAAILNAWYLRDVTVHDLSARVPLAFNGDWRPNPGPQIIHRPNLDDAKRVLYNWQSHAYSGNVLRLSHDIETARGVITCMAFADGPYASGSTALVIPFVRPSGPNSTFENYWTEREEFELTRMMVDLWSYPNVRIEGQNYNYDTQWIEAFYGSRPNLDFDTMLAHHLLWPGTPKALDYISSLYNHYYWYWKDDNKEWDVKGNFDQHLRYNAEDALRTFECATELRNQIKAQNFEALWEIEKEKNSLALDMMRRGVAIDKSRRTEMGFWLQSEKGRINTWLRSLMPQSFLGDLAPKTSTKCWWESTHQQKTLFYNVLGIKAQKKRKTGAITIDAEALEKLRTEAPELVRIWDALETQRSISVFHDTFIAAKLEPDGRFKSSFNTAGTETFRWSSSTNAFWRGGNLQNIPKGEEKE